MRLNSFGGRAVVAATFVVAIFAWGLAFYGLGFYLRQLHEGFGWSVLSLSMVTLVFHLCATVASFAVSAALVRAGPRAVFLFGAAALGTGVFTVGQVNARWQLVGCYVVMALGWASLNSNPISATVLEWYPQRSGPPLAVALTGASVGGVVVIPLLTATTERYGLPAALRGFALAALLIVGALALLVIRSPASGARASRSAPVAAGSKRKTLLTQRGFWTLSTALALGIAAQVGFLVHQLNLLGEFLDDTTGARIVAATTVSALAGRLLFIAVANRVAVAVLGAAYLAVQGIALAVFGAGVGGRSAAAATLWSVLFGVGVGVLITIPPLLTRSTFPDVAFTTAFPVVNVGYQLAIAVGAPLTALGQRLLGGYGPTLAILGVADAAAALLLLRNWQHTRTAGEPATLPP